MTDALDRLFYAAKTPPPAVPVSPPATSVPVSPPSRDTPKEGLHSLPDEYLTDFPDQPFKPYTGEKLDILRDSIIANGIIEPLIVRPFAGKYQIVSGHNRRAAGRLAGYADFPCVVRELDDDEATLQMVETNLRRRDDLLPSEKARAYRLRMETLNRRGERTDANSGHDVHKSRDEVGAEVSMSGRQVQRYVRLSFLVPPLLELVDEGKLIMNAGIELAYLSTESQSTVHHFFYLQQSFPISQHIANQLRKLDADPLTETDLLPFLSPSVIKPFRKVTVTMKPIRRFFKPEATPKEVEKTIVAALTAYFKEDNK